MGLLVDAKFYHFCCPPPVNQSISRGKLGSQLNGRSHLLLCNVIRHPAVHKLQSWLIALLTAPWRVACSVHAVPFIWPCSQVARWQPQGRIAVIHWLVPVGSEWWVNCEESIYSRPIACRLARFLALYPPCTSRLAPRILPRPCIISILEEMNNCTVIIWISLQRNKQHKQTKIKLTGIIYYNGNDNANFIANNSNFSHKISIKTKTSIDKQKHQSTIDFTWYYTVGLLLWSNLQLKYSCPLTEYLTTKFINGVTSVVSCATCLLELAKCETTQAPLSALKIVKICNISNTCIG